MQDNNQFEQLMLQYSQLKSGSEEIRKLISIEDYDSAITMLKNREPLLLSCKCMRRFLELTKEQEAKLKEVLDDLSEYEKENMRLIQEGMTSIKEELLQTQKSEKIQKIYNQKEADNGNLVNLSE